MIFCRFNKDLEWKTFHNDSFCIIISMSSVFSRLSLEISLNLNILKQFSLMEKLKYQILITINLICFNFQSNIWKYLFVINY